MPICWSYILLMLAARSNWRIFLLCGFIVGILPQVQGHSLITLLEWTFAHAVVMFPWKSCKEMKNMVLHYFVLGIPALVLAVPQLLPFVARVSKEKFVTFVPIWADDQLNFFIIIIHYDWCRY
jgi:hypothetical protein